MKRPALLFLACVAALTPGAARAEAASWTSNGPYGGEISTLLVDPTTPGTVYAATTTPRGKGLYKSTDGALTWQPFNDGLLGPDGTALVLSLALAPSDPSTLYAGFAGIHKSTDGGRTWTITGRVYSIIYSLAVDPTAPDVVYAGLGLNPLGPEGVMKSVDGGDHWSLRNQGLPESSVTNLLIDPSDPDTLYAGTASRGVYKSTDGAESWAPASSGLRALGGPEARYVYALVMDPANPRTLYAGTNVGIFKTTDGAATWHRVFVYPPSPSIEAMAIDPVNPNAVYAVTDRGLVGSTNGGIDWMVLSFRLKFWQPQTLAVDPHQPSVLYAGTHGGGVFKSASGGRSWTFASSGMTDASVAAIAVDPSDSDVVYAGIYGGGVARTTDRGESWQRSNDLLSSPRVRELAIDPATPTTVYAGTEDGVATSTDGAATWRNVHLERGVNALAIDPRSPKTVYAGFGLGIGCMVLKTTNRGWSWRPAGAGLRGNVVISLAIDPSTPTTLYAVCTEAGLFKSTDAGGSWRLLDLGIPEINPTSVVIDPADPQTLYAAGRAVLKSVDGGETWTLITAGFPPTGSGGASLAIDPVDSRTLYASTRAGVFRSSDGGASWSPLGLENRSGAPLAVDPNQPEVVYVGGIGGVFRLVEESESPPEPPPPPGTDYLSSSEIPGFRFQVRFTAGEQVIAGRQESDCLGETLCVSGAVPGRSELLLRMTGPRPNGFLWTSLVRFTPSRVEVWAEQISTGRINYYDLPALPPEDDELSGLVDKAAFVPEGSAPASASLARSRPLGAPGVELADPAGLPSSAAAVIAGPAPVTFTSDAFPGFVFKVRILSGGEEQPTRVESECLPETVCVSGALPGRSELFLRMLGPRPNGFLWVNLVRFTTSRVEVEIERLDTGERRSYVLEEVPRQSDRLPGRVDRHAFTPP